MPENQTSTPATQPNILDTIEINADRKTFVVQHGKNHRGEFVRIIEEVGSHRDMIVIPMTTLSDIIVALGRIHQS